MPSVERSFTVVPAPSVVLEYLQDFGHAERWDPGTASCTRTDRGPIRVGASWRNVSKIAGVRTELTYTLTRLTGDAVQFVGTNKTARSTDTITVAPAGPGCRITYRADLELHGAAKLAGPVFKLLFERLASSTGRQLSDVLNGLTSDG